MSRNSSNLVGSIGGRYRILLVSKFPDRLPNKPRPAQKPVVRVSHKSFVCACPKFREHRAQKELIVGTSSLRVGFPRSFWPVSQLADQSQLMGWSAAGIE
jgi:hypothetical protein